ncbi:MAG TPA: dipicolinate synthase subunit B [Oscillospiraceae bacterium]|nr:dipicolinate synthase subunit B [Oscillospiraceae bacterium]HNW05307.1 dipicolinate synthase subunit B [Oscillospiraceae bacterium]HPW00075.1 dipicolinate synthase subunit B [Oscillospiraceae bacterium]
MHLKDKIRLGFALCGSFCTFDQAFAEMEALTADYEITPIFSFNASSMDTRFGPAGEFVRHAEEICGRKAILTIQDAEPVGPQKLFDIVLVEPCTGNTLAKLAGAVTDTPVTMAVKAHLRNSRPAVLAVSTNDALSGSAVNIGRLLNARNVYFVPMRQDNPEKKPRSMVADFTKTAAALEKALSGEQVQPILTG